MLLRAAQKNQRHNFLYVRLNGKLKSWVMSIKTIFKILLVASLAFPEAFGQQQNAQEGNSFLLKFALLKGSRQQFRRIH